MAGNERIFALRLLTTTRSTGASRGGRRRGGAAVDGRGVHRHQSSVRQDHAAQAPALHRCHERHHVPHHSIYHVHGGGLRSHRGRSSIELPGLATTTPFLVCPLRLARNAYRQVRPQPGGHIYGRRSSLRQRPAVHGVQRGFVCYQFAAACWFLPSL